MSRLEVFFIEDKWRVLEGPGHSVAGGAAWQVAWRGRWRGLPPVAGGGTTVTFAVKPASHIIC